MRLSKVCRNGLCFRVIFRIRNRLPHLGLGTSLTWLLPSLPYQHHNLLWLPWVKTPTTENYWLPKASTYSCFMVSYQLLKCAVLPPTLCQMTFITWVSHSQLLHFHKTPKLPVEFYSITNHTKIGFFHFTLLCTINILKIRSTPWPYVCCWAYGGLPGEPSSWVLHFHNCEFFSMCFIL